MPTLLGGVLFEVKKGCKGVGATTCIPFWLSSTPFGRPPPPGGAFTCPLVVLYCCNFVIIHTLYLLAFAYRKARILCLDSL
jgi:hypothetical protein